MQKIRMLSLSFGGFKVIEGCYACAGKFTAAFTSTSLTAEYGLKFWIDLERKKGLVTCPEIRHASWKVGFRWGYSYPVYYKYKKDPCPPLVPPPHSRLPGPAEIFPSRYFEHTVVLIQTHHSKSHSFLLPRVQAVMKGEGSGRETTLCFSLSKKYCLSDS